MLNLNIFAAVTDDYGYSSVNLKIYEGGKIFSCRPILFRINYRVSCIVPHGLHLT